VLLDEADRLIDEHSFSYRSLKDNGKKILHGLVTLVEVKKSYWLSATYDPYHDTFL
jgi:hypothetical protein